MEQHLPVHSDELRKRIDNLQKDIEGRIPHERKRKEQNLWIAILLMAVTVLCSVIAGFGGLANQFSPQIVGALALVPAALAFVASVFKFQGRASWHIRKWEGLLALRSRLLYQLPVNPTADNVAAIAAALDRFTEDMRKEWEQEFSLDWGRFHTPHNVSPPTSGRADHDKRPAG